MARSLLIAGIVLSVLAILCGIAALGTSNWMKACMSFKDIMASLPSSQQAQSGLGPLKDSDLCIGTGLFRLSFYLTNLGISSSINLSPNAWDIFIEATAGLMVTGVIVLIIGVVMLSLSVCSRSMNSQRKVSASAYARIGVGILIAGTALYGIGVTVYTIEQSKTVHNPTNFLMQMGNAMQTMMERMHMGGGSPSNGMDQFGGNGRKRRQSDYPPLPQNGDISDLGNLLPPVHGYAPPSDISSNDNYNGAQDMQQQMIQDFVKSIDPMFDYSFFVAWVGFVFGLLAVIVTALTCRRAHPYGDDMQPVL